LPAQPQNFGSGSAIVRRMNQGRLNTHPFNQIGLASQWRGQNSQIEIAHAQS
jgi:hypothetical protein